jgi:hypothetical protein
VLGRTHGRGTGSRSANNLPDVVEDLSRVRKRSAQWCVWAFCLLWLLEGILRKWLLPSLASPLFFAKVPFEIALVGLTFRNVRHEYPKLSGTATLVAIGLSAFTILHVMSGDQTPTVALYGFSQYVIPLFVPAAIAVTVDRLLIKRMFGFFVVTLWPMALLTAFQSVSPLGSWINRVSDPDSSRIFTSALGVVRSTSTFTSPAGHATYVCFVLAVTLGVIFTDGKSRYRLLVAMLPPLVVLLVASGRRQIILYAALGGILFISIRTYQRPATILWAAGIGFTCYMLWSGIVNLGGQPLEALMLRFHYASQDENTLARLTLSIKGFLHPPLPQPPFFGDGLGQASRGGVIAASSKWIEDELSRWVEEMGALLALIMIALRWSILGILFSRVILMKSDPLRSAAVALWSFAGFIWLCGQVTGQGSVGGFAWLSAGLVLGILRVAGSKANPVPCIAIDEMSTAEGTCGESHRLA